MSDVERVGDTFVVKNPRSHVIAAAKRIGPALVSEVQCGSDQTCIPLQIWADAIHVEVLSTLGLPLLSRMNSHFWSHCCAAAMRIAFDAWRDGLVEVGSDFYCRPTVSRKR